MPRFSGTTRKTNNVFLEEIDLPQGTLRKGFTIKTPQCTVTIQKGATVNFEANTQTITFKDVPDVTLVKNAGRWFAVIYSMLMPVLFDFENPPYPLSYFRK